jgi:SH3-like domain-containing protein
MDLGMIRKRITTLFFTLTLLGIATAASARMVAVNADMINMRSGPGSNFKVVWELGRGYPLKVIGTQGQWYRVVDFENDKGWVYKKLVDRSSHFVVKNKVINIRSGAGTRYKIIRQAKRGVVLKTLQHKAGWAKVRHEEENIEGWVKRDLLWGW